MNIKIAPSLLSADFGRLKEEIQAAEQAGADLFHLDIMDGHFVPNLTFGMPIIKAIKKYATIPLDCHLMVLNPDDYISPLSDIGVGYFSFHIEVTHHPHRLLQKIKTHNMKAGIAINPGTPISLITELLPDIDFVLVMSVNPGFAGQEFIPSATHKIEHLSSIRAENQLYYEIEIDGGINDETIKSLPKDRTDIVVAGSYIFGQTNYTEAIRKLYV